MTFPQQIHPKSDRLLASLFALLEGEKTSSQEMRAFVIALEFVRR